MITGVISKEKAKRESLSDTIAGAAVAIVKAVTPRQNVQPSQAPTTSMSPSKSADLRFNNWDIYKNFIMTVFYLKRNMQNKRKIYWKH